MLIDDVAFGSAAQDAGLDWDQEVLRVLKPCTAAQQIPDVHPGTAVAGGNRDAATWSQRTFAQDCGGLIAAAYGSGLWGVWRHLRNRLYDGIRANARSLGVMIK